MTKHSASASAIGYLYQLRIALLLALKDEGQSVLLEALDDVEIVDKSGGRRVLQLKHVSGTANLTDASPDLWKTIRIWASHWAEGRLTDDTLLLLMTTASAPDGSIANLLKHPKAPVPAIVERLDCVAEGSSNQSLRAAFDAYLGLSRVNRRELVLRIRVLDRAVDIQGVEKELLERLSIAVAPEHRRQALERLEGWWLPVAIDHLKSSSPIRSSSVFARVRDVAWSFSPRALPIDFRDARPDNEIDPSSDDRPFVLQLKAISVNLKRVEKAILDYYRAFEQRAKWVREDLIIEQDLGEYENRLVEEWDRMRLTLADELPEGSVTEEKMQEAGRKLLTWMEWEANVPIRPRVDEGYVMRGSYHILANQGAASRVWWHPEFPERVAEILGLERPKETA